MTTTAEPMHFTFARRGVKSKTWVIGPAHGPVWFEVKPSDLVGDDEMRAFVEQMCAGLSAKEATR